MYVVVSSTRKLIKPRACLFHHFNRKPQLKQRLERILMHSCVASHAYCKCLFKPRTSLQKDAGLGSVSQQTQFSVPQIACALSHTLTRLTTKAIVLYTSICGEAVPQVTFLTHPTGIPGGAGRTVDKWLLQQELLNTCEWGCESMCCCADPAYVLLSDQGEWKE